MSSGPDSSPSLETHPIHLLGVRTTRIHFEARTPDIGMSPEQKAKLVPTEMKLEMGHSDVLEGPIVQVALGCSVVFKEDQKVDGRAPYSLSAQVAGIAKWDRKELSDEIALAWARRGAPYALFPYLRALVSEVTALSGFAPVTLPLLILPTVRVERDEQPTTDL